jgi:hypothetical protein
MIRRPISPPITEAGRRSFWVQRTLVRIACPMRRSRLRLQNDKTMLSMISLRV